MSKPRMIRVRIYVYRGSNAIEGRHPALSIEVTRMSQPEIQRTIKIEIEVNWASLVAQW